MNIKKNVKNNTYYFSISLGFDPVTKKRRQTMRSGFKTIRDAERCYSTLKYEFFEGKHKMNAEKISFFVLCGIYAKERKDKVKTTTYNAEQSNIQIHILPYFEHANIKKVKRTDILLFQSHLQDKGLCNNTVNKIMLALKMVFDCAINHHFLENNPCLHVRPLKVEKKKMDFWLPEEFQIFISSIQKIEQPIHTLFFTFAYLTGARLSEILGARWTDINFDTNTWRVSHSLNYDKFLREYYLDTPKTMNSLRSIGLPLKLIEMLQTYQKVSKHDFIFGQEITYPSGKHFTRLLPKHIEITKVKRIRFHDLRHSHVALLIDMGEQDFIIKERLGHASIKITYDIYGHLFPTRQQELADRLNNFF